MGKTAKIQVQGIQRNNPIGQDNEGAMQEIINLRPDKGAWRPVGQKPGTDETPIKYTKYIHKISDSKEVHWFVDGTDIGYELYINGVIDTTDTSFDTTSLSGAAKFSSLGYVVIMMETNSEELRAYVFENDSDTYRLVGDLLPDLIQATIRETDIGYTSYTNIFRATIAEMDEALPIEVEATWRNDYTSDNYWLNPLYFRYAYELFDGSIVKHSQPIRVRGSFVDNVVETGGTIFQYRYYLREVIFKVIDTGLAAVQSDYEGIIKSVNIYICRPHEDFDLGSALGVTPNRYYTATMKPTKIDKIDSFYLVKSIALNELSTSDVDPLDGVDMESLTTNTTLPFGDIDAHEIYSDNPFVYNQRMLFSTIKNTLFKGFVPDMSNPDTVGSGSSYQFRFEVTVATPEGDKIVRSDLSVQTYQTPVITGSIPCFGYPDTRASKLRILVYYGGNYYYHTDIALTPHKLFNFAFIEDAVWEDDVPTALQTVLNTYVDQNRIQASEIYNPFFYPAINSYRVANNSIVGLGTNAVDISAAQFGAYPIYAFTNDGIWTLEIGSGGIFIQSIKPLSRHVCNSLESIVSITGGVLFATDRGLFVISGAKPVEISQFAEGAYESPLADLGSYWATKYKGIDDVSAQQHWLTREKAVTYGGKTHIAYFDDAVSEYFVSTFNHTTKVITSASTGIGDVGTVHQASMFVDSSGYLYVIANQGTYFAYKVSASVNDPSSWGSAVNVGPNIPVAGMQVYNPWFSWIAADGEFCLFGMALYNDGDPYCDWWKITTYNGGANWHTQHETITSSFDGELMQIDPFLGEDDVLHLGISYFNGGNYTQLQYIKTDAPGEHASTFTNIDGGSESLPISGATSVIYTRPTGVNDILFVGITVNAEQDVHFAAILTGTFGDPKLIHLHYQNSSWIESTVFQSADLAATHDGPYFDSVADGMMIVFEEALRLSIMGLVTTASGRKFGVYEFVSENNGVSWNLFHKYIPVGNYDLMCVAYPKGMDTGCSLVVMKGDDDYTSNHDVVFYADDLVCTDGFLDYLETAIIGYDHQNNEIIVSNSDFDYSWVFDIDNKFWFKISQVWDAFVINFPGLYGYNTIGAVYYRYDMLVENEVDGVSIHIETRPLTLPGVGYKKIERSLIEAYLDPDIPEFLGVFLYGSVDNGVTYRLVAAGSISEVKNRFLVGRSKYSCQFFILVIGGKVEFASTVNNLLFDVKPKFQSKLR